MAREVVDGQAPGLQRVIEHSGQGQGCPEGSQEPGVLIQVSVSAMLRSPRSQTNQVRSRGVCLDQSAGSMLVKRSCDTVGKAARLATQVAVARQ
jgi:hypothetical protein